MKANMIFQKVILFTPGEIAVLGYTSYLTPRRILSSFAEAIGGAIIVLEHRYWGFSSPYAELTTENMQYLTLENSIADLTHFAQTANLPFDPHHSSNPERAVSPQSENPLDVRLLTGHGSHGFSVAVLTAEPSQHGLLPLLQGRSGHTPRPLRS